MKDHKENLKGYIAQRKAAEEEIKNEQVKLENNILNLENKLSQDLEFEEYRNCKEKLEYYKDRLNKFLSKEKVIPEDIFINIDKEFKFASEEIQKEYEMKVQAAYEKFRSSLEGMIKVVEERNIKANELNSIVIGEKGVNDRELRLEILKGFTSGEISIFKNQYGKPTIKKRHGNYAGDYSEVSIG